MELFELFETDPKMQCKECLSYWSEGIAYSTCGHLLKEIVANPRFIEFSMDLLSLPEYVIKKERPHGHRSGKTPEKKEYHLDHNLKKGCIQKNFKGIHDRFLRDPDFRKCMLEHDRDEDVCLEWDDLAEQDHTYRMSEAEYIHYKQNWWISLNKSGNDTQPERERSDFNQVLSTLNRSHQEAGGQQLRPMPYWKNKEWKPTSSSSDHLVAMERILVGFLRIHRKSNKENASKGLRSNGRNPLFTKLWRKPQTNGFHEFILFCYR